MEHCNYYMCLSNYQQKMNTVYEVDSRNAHKLIRSYYLTYREGKSYLEVPTGFLIPVSTLSSLSFPLIMTVTS